AYKGGWVAEVTVAKNFGKSLRVYLKFEKVMKRLQIAQAKVQKYSPGTPYETRAWCGRKKSGFNPRKVRQALAEVKRNTVRLTTLAHARHRHRIGHLHKEKANFEACTGAFVLFNNRESQQLCLERYSHSCGWHGRLFQPKDLRYKVNMTEGGHRLYHLRVEQAPNPSNIKWENLGVSDTQRHIRTALIHTVTFAVLLASTVVLIGLFKVSGFNDDWDPTQAKDESSDNGGKGLPALLKSYAEVAYGVGTKLDLPMSPSLLSIVIMNHVLKVLLSWLQQFERPVSLTAHEQEQGVKMFTSEFVNTAIVVLLVGDTSSLTTRGFTHQVYSSMGQDVMYAVVYIAVFP
ncbi:unnamed protein product, partial [Discosporangium mesarthrocarpum]